MLMILDTENNTDLYFFKLEYAIVSTFPLEGK